MTQAKKHIVVIGGGWAGITTAVSLTESGHQVTLLETAKQLGGRARSTPMGDITVDNGQHLMLGAYKAMLKLLDTVNVKESDVFLRTPLRLQVKCLDGDQLDLSTPILPGPLHLLVAFLKCQGISTKDKLLGLWSMDRLMKAKLTAETDISVSELLTKYGVPESIQKKLQIPLCIAALNTQPEIASAQLFINVLKEAFKTGRAASDFLIPIADLGALLPEPAMLWLKENGCDVQLEQKVSELIIENNTVTGVITNTDTISADHVVYAGNYPQGNKLLSPYSNKFSEQLSHFKDEPILTLYYQFPEHIQMENPMIGMLGGYAEWVFDRRIVGQKGLFAVVISATGPHLELSRQALADAVLEEMRTVLGNLPDPIDTLVLKEQRATFSCTVGIEKKRPQNATDIDNLWLAADHTATGFPGTLEGAVRSGYNCAELIEQTLS